jgi:hypothetical protein
MEMETVLSGKAPQGPVVARKTGSPVAEPVPQKKPADPPVGADGLQHLFRVRACSKAKIADGIGKGDH